MSVPSWSRAAVVLAASILALAALGIAYRLTEVRALAVFNLEWETGGQARAPGMRPATARDRHPVTESAGGPGSA